MTNIVDVKEGNTLIVTMDHAFCLKKDSEVIVSTWNGKLYITCDKGRYYLDGHVNKQGELIGFVKKLSE